MATFTFTPDRGDVESFEAKSVRDAQAIAAERFADRPGIIREPVGGKRIQIVGQASGGSTPADGKYVVEYDPGRPGFDADGEELVCHLVVSSDPAEALVLSGMEAFELWRSVDPRQPVRPDGKPNRPLTAYSVTIA